LGGVASNVTVVILERLDESRHSGFSGGPDAPQGVGGVAKNFAVLGGLVG
jgi:hypothetical protein